MTGWFPTFTAYDLLWRVRFWNTKFVRSKVRRQLKEQCFLLSIESMIDWPEQSVCTSESDYTTTEETFGHIYTGVEIASFTAMEILIRTNIDLKGVGQGVHFFGVEAFRAVH